MKRKLIWAIFACVIIGLTALALPTTTQPSVVLAWDQHSDPSVNGYRIYYGVQSRVYTNSIAVPGRTTTSAQVTNLVRGVEYFFAATATTTNNLESGYSIEVTFTTSPLPFPPQNLRVSILSP